MLKAKTRLKKDVHYSAHARLSVVFKSAPTQTKYVYFEIRLKVKIIHKIVSIFKSFVRKVKPTPLRSWTMGFLPRHGCSDFLLNKIQKKTTDSNANCEPNQRQQLKMLMPMFMCSWNKKTFRGHSITRWTRWGGRGQKMSVTEHAQDIKTVHTVVECPLTGSIVSWILK